jgi:hypothetical protein
MGQKINPISNRLGIIRGWDSNWYGGNNYGDTILEDHKIRKYLNARLAKASISRIIIERTLKFVTITVMTARPGIIIGKGGQEVDKLKEELKKVKGDVELNNAIRKARENNIEVLCLIPKNKINKFQSLTRISYTDVTDFNNYMPYDSAITPFVTIRCVSIISLYCCSCFSNSIVRGAPEAPLIPMISLFLIFLPFLTLPFILKYV